MNIFNGLVGLIECKRGFLCLLILSISSTALFMKHLDGMSFAGIVSTIAVIYNYTQHRIEMPK